MQLDGLRGYAAIAVVVFHSILDRDPTLNQRIVRPPIQDAHGFYDVVTKLVFMVVSGETAVVVFFVLSGAVLFRDTAPVHKRLILLATLYITDAGFGRWLFAMGMTGSDLPSFYGSLYLGPMVLILGLGAYDLVTRRRLHPAYVLGLVWIVAIQATAITLYNTPAWKSLAASWIAAA